LSAARRRAAFLLLLLLRGKIGAASRAFLRNTRRAWRKQCGRGEQACGEKRQTYFIGHGESSLYGFIVA
jgi:hypothetical protein